ncbi:hypothetical protein CI610_01808 [invertebrate metagenome]|uniref:Uncharacterized protein n=1 Tax=invertebrate metagenome TaxID=1711999 RepID=A0A2H9T7N6_9ZZZZ
MSVDASCINQQLQPIMQACARINAYSRMILECSSYLSITKRKGVLPDTFPLIQWASRWKSLHTQIEEVPSSILSCQHQFVSAYDELITRFELAELPSDTICIQLTNALSHLRSPLQQVMHHTSQASHRLHKWEDSVQKYKKMASDAIEVQKPEKQKASSKRTWQPIDIVHQFISSLQSRLLNNRQHVLSPVQSTTDKQAFIPLLRQALLVRSPKTGNAPFVPVTPLTPPRSFFRKQERQDHLIIPIMQSLSYGIDIISCDAQKTVKEIQRINDTFNNILKELDSIIEKIRRTPERHVINRGKNWLNQTQALWSGIHATPDQKPLTKSLS